MVGPHLLEREKKKEERRRGLDVFVIVKAAGSGLKLYFAVMFNPSVVLVSLLPRDVLVDT